MSAETIPSPWAQAFPRSLRIDPGGPPLSAGMLRAILARQERLVLLWTGDAMIPAIGDGARVTVAARVAARPGDLVVVETGGWGDLRRLVGRGPGGAWMTAIDTLPAGRETVDPGRLLGVVVAIDGRSRRGGRAMAALRPLHARWAAAWLWIDRIRRAPLFGGRAIDSVAAKYAQQVEGYGDILDTTLPDPVERMIRARLGEGARILVAGCGAGGEAIALARSGLRVVGVDVVPTMVAAARRHAAAAGLEIEVLEAEISTLDPGARRFDAVYFTPMVYAFIPDRRRRVGTLRRLGRHLSGPEAAVVFSVALRRGLRRRAETRFLHLRRRLAGVEGEPGDWYTRFLTPAGEVGTSFVHYATRREVEREIAAAGYAVRESEGVFYRISGFAGAGVPVDPPRSASIAGQNDRSLRK